MGLFLVLAILANEDRPDLVKAALPFFQLAIQFTASNKMCTTET